MSLGRELHASIAVRRAERCLKKCQYGRVTAVSGHQAAGKNLSPQFEHVEKGVFEWKLKLPGTVGSRRTLSVSVKNQHGNVTRIRRNFWVQ